jgi:hypothetical protein
VVNGGWYQVILRPISSCVPKHRAQVSGMFRQDRLDVEVVPRVGDLVLRRHREILRQHLAVEFAVAVPGCGPTTGHGKAAAWFSKITAAAWP